jgi:uncharacterized protein (DUF2141 family)
MPASDLRPTLNDKLERSYPQHEKGRFRRAWKESHGFALLGFAAVILVTGLILIWASPPADDETDVVTLVDVENAVELPEDAILVRVSTSEYESTSPIRIAVYDSEQAFGDPSKAIIKDSLNPVDGFAVWEIKLDFLPEQFAIAAYHDLDDNGQLNRALFNAPVEPYGFSNNARSLVGAPTYEQTVVQRPSASTAIEVRVY